MEEYHIKKLHERIHEVAIGDAHMHISSAVLDASLGNLNMRTINERDSEAKKKLTESVRKIMWSDGRPEIRFVSSCTQRRELA